MKISVFRTNADFELNGVWLPIGDGGELKIARMNNLRYLAKCRELSKPYAHLARTNEVPIDKQVEIINIALAETVLLDWKGIELDDGTPVPYDHATALEYISTIPDFRELVMRLATEQMFFRDRDVENDIKNS